MKGGARLIRGERKNLGREGGKTREKKPNHGRGN